MGRKRKFETPYNGERAMLPDVEQKPKGEEFPQTRIVNCKPCKGAGCRACFHSGYTFVIPDRHYNSKAYSQILRWYRWRLDTQTAIHKREERERRIAEHEQSQHAS